MPNLVIDGVIFGLQKAGGISRVWFELLYALEECAPADYKIFVLVPTNHNVEWDILRPKLKRIEIVKRRRFRWGKTRFFIDSLYLTFLAFKLRPKVWHCSYYVGMPFAFCKKKILTYHDMISEKMKIASAQDTKGKYRAVKKADILVSPSAHALSDLLQFWPEFLQKQARVIAHCVPTLSFPTCCQKPFPYLLYIGKRGGYKNFYPTIKAILGDKRFDHLHIKVVGGEEILTQEESVLFLHEERLQKLNTQPQESVFSLIHGCQALLFPSLYEGFGLPVLEAFAFGVPVLAHRSSSIPEIAGEDYPLAELENPKSLLDTLDLLLKERNRWTAYGKKRVSLFSRGAMIEAYLKIYEHGFKSSDRSLLLQ